MNLSTTDLQRIYDALHLQASELRETSTGMADSALRASMRNEARELVELAGRIEREMTK